MLSKPKYQVLLSCALILLISACEDKDKPEPTPDPVPTPVPIPTPDNKSTYTINPFTAKYYFEDDGREPGIGTDGTDPSIVPILMHTETVSRPAIAYPYAYEFGIDSYNLYTVWEGEIIIHEETELNANFDISWSDVTFYIDDILISKWKNSTKIIPLNLGIGAHSVRIEYHNHWHTTGFNLSFTNYPKTNVSEDLSSRIKDTTQISYIVTYDVAHITSIYNCQR